MKYSVEIGGSAFEIEVTDGRVTLNGRVPTQAQKTLAGDIAKAKATGYVVRNLLTVAR